MPSLDRQLQEVAEALEGPGRCMDLQLALRREKTRETLLMAGGVWDRLENRFIDGQEPATCGVVDLEESQVEFTLWFAQFLADYREGYPRDFSLVLAAGDRRAGKTFAAFFCQLAALIDVPRIPGTNLSTIGWAVSKTYRERAELDDLVAAYVPATFYHHRRAPEHRYDLPHGAVLRNLSADDPDGLKQGRCDFVLYNEPQKMQARGIVHGLYGTADQAGLVILAANRPSEHDSHGEWLFDLREAIDDEVRTQAKERNVEPLGARFFGLSSKGNTKIDQPARRRVARLAAIIDPSQAEADDDDSGKVWQKPGDRVSREYDKHRHLGLVPDVGIRDCTQEVIERRGGVWGSWTAAAGADFQSRPHIAGVIARCFGDPDDPIYWFVGEHVERADERLYLANFEERFGKRGFTKESLLWIGDASGSWQNAKHGEGARTSFEVWRDEGWEIVPPQDPKSDADDARARNPFVDDQLQLWNELLRRDRIRFDPKHCEWLIKCVKEASTKRDSGRRRIVQNKYAHTVVAALYLVWRLASETGGKGFDPSDVRIVDLQRHRR